MRALSRYGSQSKGNRKKRGISSEELSLWLRNVDGGEMVLIADVCHSAASVEGEGFKPGPMGSRGLNRTTGDWHRAALSERIHTRSL